MTPHRTVQNASANTMHSARLPNDPSQENDAPDFLNDYAELYKHLVDNVEFRAYVREDGLRLWPCVVTGDVGSMPIGALTAEGLSVG